MLSKQNQKICAPLLQVNLEAQQGIQVGKDPGAEFVCQIRLLE